jgi:hypothetical protein
MRTVRRESLKLNKAKFDALERIARAFAHDKQAHLDFYQHDLNFSGAQSYRLRRNELKTTDHHASTPLSVHASDLAVKAAFETEVKYWAAIGAEIHPRIASRQWTPEQKHYAYWLLGAEHRFSLLILDRAPINEKISLAVGERKQVQNYLRRRARRIMKARPGVKIARSFALDSTLYATGRTLTGQGLAISSLEKGKRIFIPLQGEGDISGNIRIVLDPESRKVEAHVSSEVKVRVNASEKVIAADAGLTEVFVDDEGNHYGCGHRGDADQIAAQNQKSRYYDRRITLYTPKETVREILLNDYQSRLEHPNASQEKIRKMTVPGQTLEREQAPGSKSSRQSKSKTAAGKKTKSAAMN